jgi:hypothetical protein
MEIVESKARPIQQCLDIDAVPARAVGQRRQEPVKRRRVTPRFGSP